MILYELRKQTSRFGEVRLVEKEELANHTGFRSVYGFMDKAIEHIRATHSTKGLKGFDLYSDELLVDFDDQPEEAHVFLLFLLQRRYSHAMYNSGGRSIHFHVPIVPMQGPLVPESQKTFMKTISPFSDLSIYKTSGMYRLPGTFHSKNRGRFKHLISEVTKGGTLEIPLLEKSLKPDNSVFSGHALEDEGNLEVILMQLLTTPISKGTVGRNNVLFKIAALCKDIGMNSKECELLCFLWNSAYSNPPLEPISIISTIQSAYGG